MSSTLPGTPQILDYVQRVGVREHPALLHCREETHRELAAYEVMQISPEQGALMQVLARAINARVAVEVGVFTGYSSTATALALKAATATRPRSTPATSPRTSSSGRGGPGGPRASRR